MLLLFFMISVFFNCSKLHEPTLSVENSYIELESKIQTFEEGDSTAMPYVNIFIQKSKIEKKNRYLLEGYKKAFNYTPKNSVLNYIDSCIIIGKNNDDVNLGDVYILKGDALIEKRKYEKALKNYLVAEEFLYNSKDDYSKNKLKYAIGQIKSFLRIYDEAYSMIESANQYFSKLETHNDTVLYLESLNSLKDINTQLGNYEIATHMYYIGMDFNLNYKNKEKEALYNLYEGVNHYEQKKYKEAIFLISQAIPILDKEDNKSKLAFALFYLGLSHYEIGNIERSIPYLIKADAISSKLHYVQPRFRVVYEIMVDYYKNIGDKQLQLQSISRLLQVVEELSNQFRIISLELKKDYDTKLLIRENQQLKEFSLLKVKNSVACIVGLFLLNLFLVIINFKNQRDKASFRDLYKSLIDKVNGNHSSYYSLQSKVVREEKKTINISNEVIEDVLIKLNELEQSKFFIENNVTCNSLAKKLHTNTTYLSNIINQKKGKNFIQYVNEIRIKYLLELFESDPKIRYYTILSLAEEVGYKNSKTFKSAFKDVTGVPFTKYLKSSNDQEDERLNKLIQ